MASVGTLAMNLTANSAGFTKGVNEAARSLNAFQSQVSTIGGSIGGRLAGLIGVGGGAGFLGWGVKLAADAETAQASFAILAGSAESARRVLADIKTISQQSPLSQAGLRDAASVMMQFGVEASTVTARLRNLGDLSMGNEQRLGSLALAFGQMTTAGRLMGQDLLQMVNAGFNPLQQISKKTGESMADLKARMEAGGISSKEVADAFDAATAAGGRFHGMLDARAGTTAGGFAKMQASAAALAQSIGEALLPAANDLLAAVTPVIQEFAKLDDTTRSNIIKVVTLGGAVLAGVVAFRGLVSIVRTAVAAYQAFTAAQIIAQAFSGPKGWLALAGGVAAAGAAIAATTALMRNVGSEAQATAPKIEASAGAMKSAADAAKTLVQFTDKLPRSLDVNFGAKITDDATKQLDDLLKRGQEVAKQFRTPGEEFRDSIELPTDCRGVLLRQRVAATRHNTILKKVIELPHQQRHIETAVKRQAPRIRRGRGVDLHLYQIIHDHR
jgi:tape measure domain-containing protein